MKQSLLMKLVLVLFVLFQMNPTLSSPRNPQPEIRQINGLPTLHVDGKPLPPFAYMSYLGEEKYYQEAATAGIHLFCFPAYLGDRGINTRTGIGPFRPGIWRGPNEFDFSSLEADFDEILKADPEALIIIRLHLDPPAWWEKAHPEACCQLPDGTTLRQCFAAEKWRTMTGETLTVVINWLLQSRYADHLLGLHIAGGFTEEWFYHYKKYFYDQNPIRTQEFRKWLAQKYQQNPTALREAWQNETIDFETANLADISGVDSRMEWRNPQTEQNVIDTFQFHSSVIVRNITYFCRLTKQVSQQRLLTGAFYGYHFYVGDGRRGYGALKELIDCEALDFMSSPNAYLRVAGEDWPPMSAIQTIQLHGKLWLAENDTRTSITTLLKDRAPEACPPGQYESAVWHGPKDLETSVALLQKNAARMLAYGYGGWWFDMWGGWFSHPQLLNVLQSTQSLWELNSTKPVSSIKPEVVVFIDEELPFYDASFGELTEKIMSNRYSLGKMGTGYDLFWRFDWENVRKSNYKFIWILGWPELNQSELKEIARLKDAGIFVFMTDLSGSQVYNPEAEEDKVFPGKYNWTGTELGGLLNQAGVHRYLETEDVVYAGNGWLSIHTATGGSRHITLPGLFRIEDPLNQQIIQESCQYFDIDLPKNSTRIFKVIPLE